MTSPAVPGVVRVYVDGQHAKTVPADEPRTLEQWLPADGQAHAVVVVVAPDTRRRRWRRRG